MSARINTAFIAATLAAPLYASEIPQRSDQQQQPQAIEQVEVTGRRVNLLGESISASQGLVGQQEIDLRPLLRSGEILELVPGMVVTQHSGTGKANQYFLRGFNLDHGTDFATAIDGMPINMRSHGHGQGYSDLNFIIPEAVDSLIYKKGAYYADVGDFSGAGSAEFKSASRLERGLLEVSAGADDYSRLVALDSVSNEQGDWLYALEHNRYNGPWSDISEDLNKTNLLLKHSRKLADGDFSLSFMAYDNSWNSADQIPLRAVDDGLIDELGSIDDSTGGESSRYSLSANWQGERGQWSAYAIRYDMTLWSNFTYQLDDQDNGDQFEQVDQRWIYGGSGSYRFDGTLAGMAMSNKIGGELRYDAIDEVGLYKSKQRQRLGAVNSDTIDQLSSGLYWENQLAWSQQLKTVIGARYDYYQFDVDSRVKENVNGIDLGSNGGSDSDDLFSLKASVIYSLNPEWETYASAGQGFHSNDARGTTIEIDPADGSRAESVDPLVKSLGYEVGLRGFINESINTSLALWYLQLDSELLFVGDAGNTEASGKTERHGLELTAYYHLDDHWTLDLEYAWSDARFSDAPAGAEQIPGAIEHVWQAGISANFDSGLFGSLRLRYFGERPLEETGTIKSASSTLVNLSTGYRWQQWQVKAELLNLLDSDDHDIDYYYESRLPGETAGQEGIHYHLLEPRTLRVSARYQY